LNYQLKRFWFILEGERMFLILKLHLFVLLLVFKRFFLLFLDITFHNNYFFIFLLNLIYPFSFLVLLIYASLVLHSIKLTIVFLFKFLNFFLILFHCWVLSFKYTFLFKLNLKFSDRKFIILVKLFKLVYLFLVISSLII